jgi:hypothetical protein
VEGFGATILLLIWAELRFVFLLFFFTNDKNVPLNLYDQLIDDHIIFTNVVSIKNTDVQFYLFWWVI